MFAYDIFRPASAPGAQLWSELRESLNNVHQGGCRHLRASTTSLALAHRSDGPLAGAPNLRPRIIGFAASTHPRRLLKAFGASRCAHFNDSGSFGSSTATCFRAG